MYKEKMTARVEKAIRTYKYAVEDMWHWLECSYKYYNEMSYQLDKEHVADCQGALDRVITRVVRAAFAETMEELNCEYDWTNSDGIFYIEKSSTAFPTREVFRAAMKLQDRINNVFSGIAGWEKATLVKDEANGDMLVLVSHIEGHMVYYKKFVFVNTCNYAD